MIVASERGVPMKRNRRALVVLSLLLAAIVRAAGQNQTASDWDGKAKTALSVLQGKIRLAGLHEPVRVLRDKWGVAHIFAANQHDLFFAQGYVAAEDRLFQMELWKRSGQGRLAEVMGESELQHDIRARLLRYRGDMNAEYLSYSPDTREILEAFTSGINSYIQERTAPGGQLPVEFEAAGFAPEPWEPKDCLNRMAAFSMTGNAFSELADAQLLTAAGADRATALAGFDPPVELDPARGTDYAGLSPELLKDLVGSDRRMAFSGEVKEGSNDWTVSGKLTATRKPLLANDPHRIIAEPSLRYIVHLVAPGWNVIGAGEPALPGVAAGHNEKIAWGFTIFGLDQQDLYLEEKNPSNAGEYRTEGGWRAFQLERDSVRVRGRAPVEVQLKFTRHGPVLWEDSRRALVLRWVGAEPGTAGYLGSLALDRAGTWEQFTGAMERWKVPSENIVYADIAGNIGEFSAGLAPVRKNWTGLLPVPGAEGFEWSGFVPTGELPHSFNPAAQFIATANHKMIPDGYPYKVGYQWASPERFLRISEVLKNAQAARHLLTVEDMQALQSDVYSAQGCELQRLLRQTGTKSELSRRMMLDWDCNVRADSGAAALYEVWLSELQGAVLEKSVPADLRKLVHGMGAEQELRRFLGQASDDERKIVLLRTLDAAAEKMKMLEGADPTRWSWGQLHVLRLRHPLDAILPGALVDPPVIERPGDGHTVNATAYSGSANYEQLAGASYREVLDLENWDHSVAVNAPGQSGQPGSKHYADLLPFWANGRYFPLVYSKTAVEQNASDLLELVP
jgi:penicillin G amidase